MKPLLNDYQRINYCYENIDKLELADRDDYAETISEFLFSECFVQVNELHSFFTVLKGGSAMDLINLLTGHSTNSDFLETVVEELDMLLDSYEDAEDEHEGLTIIHDEA